MRCPHRGILPRPRRATNQAGDDNRLLFDLMRLRILTSAEDYERHHTAGVTRREDHAPLGRTARRGGRGAAADEESARRRLSPGRG